MTRANSKNEPATPTLYTIGHSTRSEEEFDQILFAHDIKILVDVRTFPGSRRYPHFNRERLIASLPEIGIEYVHLAALGGRRKALPNSRNTAWKNPSFRGYADYMDSQEFRDGIEKLLGLMKKGRTAIMCAEAVWWRCHRSLISDYLKARGANVLHIVNESRVEVHPYTSAARIVDGKLSYEGLLGDAAQSA